MTVIDLTARCKCGHQKSAHAFDRRIPASPKDSCRATIYQQAVRFTWPGDSTPVPPERWDSWPCPCSKFEDDE